MFSLTNLDDLKPDKLSGQKSSMKSMSLRKVQFSYVLVFSDLLLSLWDLDDIKLLLNYKHATAFD